MLECNRLRTTPLHDKIDMILEVLANARNIGFNFYAQAPEAFSCAHARQHQQLRRIDRASTQDDFTVGPDLVAFSAMPDRDGFGPTSMDHDFFYKCVRHDGQVRAPGCRVKIGDSCRTASPIPFRAVVAPHTFRSESVQIVRKAKAGLDAGCQKGIVKDTWG